MPECAFNYLIIKNTVLPEWSGRSRWCKTPTLSVLWTLYRLQLMFKISHKTRVLRKTIFWWQISSPLDLWARPLQENLTFVIFTNKKIYIYKAINSIKDFWRNNKTIIKLNTDTLSNIEANLTCDEMKFFIDFQASNINLQSQPKAFLMKLWHHVF